MSHFTVMVIGNEPEKLLAPFQENNMGDCPEEYLEFFKEFTLEQANDEWQACENCSSYETVEEYMKNYHGLKFNEELEAFGYFENPNRKWDWYTLGGRWSGLLKTKSSKYVDSAFKREIDVEGMRKEARERAEKRYDFASSVIGHIKKDDFLTWKSLIKKYEKGKITIEQARIIYHNQPGKVEFEEASRTEEGRELVGVMANIEDYLVSKEEYLKKAENNAIATFALLNEDGWYERGSMGWWATVSDEKDNWEEEFAKLFDSIPDDTLISIYDCHI